MDRQLDKLIKQLQDISEIVSSFNSEAVQLRVVDWIFPFLEAGGKRNGVSHEMASSGSSEKEVATTSKEKKPRLKQTLIELIQNSFFDDEKSIGQIVRRLNEPGYDYQATQVSGILLGLIKDEKLERFQSSINNRYVYLKPQNS